MRVGSHLENCHASQKLLSAIERRIAEPRAELSNLVELLKARDAAKKSLDKWSALHVQDGNRKANDRSPRSTDAPPVHDAIAARITADLIAKADRIARERKPKDAPPVHDAMAEKITADLIATADRFAHGWRPKDAPPVHDAMAEKITADLIAKADRFARERKPKPER